MPSLSAASADSTIDTGSRKPCPSTGLVIATVGGVFGVSVPTASAALKMLRRPPETTTPSQRDS